MTDLAIQFFARFARLEHSLKAVAPFRDGNDDGVSPNWDRFAADKSIAASFNALHSDDRVRYLIDNPPMKRVLRDGMPDWKVMPKPGDMCQLLVAVRRVRNNLFHGDKMNPNLTRNVRLFEGCIIVLDAVLAAHDQVRSIYEDNQEIA